MQCAAGLPAIYWAVVTGRVSDPKPLFDGLTTTAIVPALIVGSGIARDALQSLLEVLRLARELRSPAKPPEGN